MNEGLDSRIREIAMKIAPDFPDIEKCDVFQQLWAIEQSYEGSELALRDWEDLTKELAKRLGLTHQELAKISRELNP